MQDDVRAFLWDVQTAADAILKFIDGIDYAAYAGNDVVHSAVERKFEIIGEALNNLSKRDAALAARVPNCREIIAFRNVLIHGYARVQHDRVWRIAQTLLPGLRTTIGVLLAELGTT